MTSFAHRFSATSFAPLTSPQTILNAGTGGQVSSLAKEGLQYDVITNSSVGSVNRSVGAPMGGGQVVEWDGRRWLVDGRDEVQLQVLLLL